MAPTDETIGLVSDDEQALAPLVKQAIESIQGGSILLADLLRALVPTPVVEVGPAQPPEEPRISADQRAALDRLPDVFGKVVPESRRALQPTEVEALYEERRTLDEIAALSEKRKEAIRTAVCNHLDVMAEELGYVIQDTIRDKHGHYVLPGEAPIPDSDKKFSREIRNHAPTVDAEALRALTASGELAHEDFLQMTSQVRVIDENKLMLALKRKPELIRVLAKATRPGSKIAQLYVRKA